MDTGHWVCSRPGTSTRPGTCLAELQGSLQKRLVGLKGRAPEKRDRCRTPQRPGVSRASTALAGSSGLSRPGSQSLPSLTWSSENPFVVPPCPHESLSQSRGETPKLRRSRSRMPRLTLSPEDRRRFLLNGEIEEQEKAEELLPEEPFVDDYLERIYPTSYQPCPHSPISSKLLPQGVARSTSKELKARLKGKRQRLLERFGTTKRAFDDFLKTIRELKKLRCWKGNMDDVELPQKMFCDFLAQHFADMPQEEHEMIFSFFDTDGSGSVSLSEFYAVVEAMSPVRCLADLRCRWIALGFSPSRAMETMAPRNSWSKRYSCQQFGQLLTKVGVCDWEEHVYIFMALASPNLERSVSMLEMHAALASVSPVLLIEEWQHRLEQNFGAMDNAYDALEGDIKAPLDLNKFVVKAGESWDMSSIEAKRFFRLCDYDGKERMTRSKFHQVLALARPSLRLERIRKKLRSHYSKLLGKIRTVNRQAKMEQLHQRILGGFLQHKDMPTRRRSRVPEDYQRMFDEIQLTPQDMKLLFELLDPCHPEKPELSCFWHMLKNFSPSVVLEDLCILSVRICASITKEVKEAQKLPSWQARQLGLTQQFSNELKTWSDVFDGSRVFDVFAGLVPGQACRAAGARREATQIAPLAAISCSANGASHLEQRHVRLDELQLKQVLHEVFFERTEVQVQSGELLELLEDSQGSRRALRGLSIAELLVAIGSMASDEPPLDATPQGRAARAQMEARSQFEAFATYALDLRAAVRQKVKSTVLPKAVATGSLEEPWSYVNLSRALEAQEENPKVLEAMQAKLETVSLVKDAALREILQREVRDEEASAPVQTTKLAAATKRPAGSDDFESFYHHMEDTARYVPDEELVERMRGYFHDAGDTVESQSALLSKKQNINSSHKSLKRALSLKRSIKDVARDL